MNLTSLGLFLVTATALLGSPGPGIASLIAIGRSAGLARGFIYYLGLQLGLAITAALCAAGLFSLISLVPGALTVMTIAATLYLIYLAWCIATAPVGNPDASGPRTASFGAGALLGLTNPKAFVAFMSLFASQTIVAGSARQDTLLKWLLVVLVILAVDLGWLLVGVSLRRANMRPALERLLNVALGGFILAATVLALL